MAASRCSTPLATHSNNDGGFLQETSRLAATDMGMFCTLYRGGVTLRLECDVDAGLWQAARLAAGWFDRVRSGNCAFSAADWISCVATNMFPSDERLRGDLR